MTWLRSVIAAVLLLPQAVTGQEATARFGNGATEFLLRSTTDIAIIRPVIDRFVALNPDLTIAYEQWGSNDLFAVSRARIRSRSREWYGTMLERLSGRAPARCDGADTRRLPGANSRLVGDCHVLEKAWHVLFGEQPTLPPASEYDAMRAPNSTLRLGGRFYEKTDEIM